ncbi:MULTISPECIES: N-ATPase subunit AtpR [Methylosinus]|uniref:ATP synthase subunit I n=1 Tax=Methylosinus trichosporium (strain ATCC 35070 / NCIMB 11131 / UNIQEM 75 / OB3b) TaxID=595536 RepID=A0A2D2CV32_METT3|nr:MULTISPECIES: ATP synthase subunit I [Methylosinus]ATQ66544.1 hypothetical protein CQW49_00530 [Methylosinus trichosporium OB3b]
MTISAAALALQLALGAGAGFAAGLAYFWALRWNVDLFEQGVTPKAVLLLIARFAALAAALAALAKIGALALLCGALGLLAARRIVLRRLGGLE